MRPLNHVVELCLHDLLGNRSQLTLHILYGNTKLLRKSFQEYYAGAKGIPSLGFVFDNTPVENEMAALGNVAAQYALALDCGAVDPETELPAFLSALDAAGMEAYLNEANAQLDAYMAK